MKLMSCSRISLASAPIAGTGTTETRRGPGPVEIMFESRFAKVAVSLHRTRSGMLELATICDDGVVQRPSAYKRSSRVMRSKYCRTGAGLPADTKMLNGPSIALAISADRRSRSLVNQRSVSRSTSGVTTYASAASARASGITNRSESLIHLDSRASDLPLLLSGQQPTRDRASIVSVKNH